MAVLKTSKVGLLHEEIFQKRQKGMELIADDRANSDAKVHFVVPDKRGIYSMVNSKFMKTLYPGWNKCEAVVSNVLMSYNPLKHLSSILIVFVFPMEDIFVYFPQN